MAVWEKRSFTDLLNSFVFKEWKTLFIGHI